jgi:hypothetical protein
LATHVPHGDDTIPGQKSCRILATAFTGAHKEREQGIRERRNTQLNRHPCNAVYLETEIQQNSAATQVNTRQTMLASDQQFLQMIVDRPD